MSYKSRFDSLEQKAHHQIIATKISKEMGELRSLVEKSPITPKRWIWELIQNAKDVHLDKGVQIRIDYQPEYVSFKHNGMPFTADNIRFLIEQISTKSRSRPEEGKSKTTGKFGTGFLTTHLLSEIVTVKGVAKEPDLDYRKFELQLDRSGFELEDITEAVKKSKESVADLDSSPIYLEYLEGDFNTEFVYPLQDKISVNVAESGLNNLEICLPYTLLFVPEIEKVEIVSSSHLFIRSKEIEKINDEISLHTVKLIDTDLIEEKIYCIVVCSFGLTSIAMPIQKDADSISLLPIDEQVPRLFCDFPLVGTEKFHVPIIINNPNFNPTDPRDGIYLTSSERVNPRIDENKSIMNEAKSLYFKLLDFAVTNNWKNLHLLAQIKSISEDFDNFWLSDIRTAIPLKLDYWKNNVESFDLLWRDSIPEEYFDENVGFSKENKNEFLNVYGAIKKYTGENQETITFTSCLVSNRGSEALLRALHTTKDSYDYYLPLEKDSDNDDSEIDEVDFTFKGWLRESRSEYDGLDTNDSLFSDSSKGYFVFGDIVNSYFNIKYDNTYTKGYFEDNEVSIYENWNEITDDNYRKYNTDTETSGCFFKVKSEFILNFLKLEQKSLIIRCIVDRQLEERNYRERNSDNTNQVKLYLIKSDGTVKTLRGRDYKIG